MLIYAHRGWSSRYPENTLRAFSEAIALGVSGIELDIHLTRDNVPVVIHDRELARTTNGNGLVEAMTLSDLRTLDAGAGERVPTLSEVLEFVAGRIHLDIEIKAAGAGKAVLADLHEFPQARWAISSFDWRELLWLRDADVSIELWPLATKCDDALLAIAAELRSPVVALASDAFDVESAEKLREAGARAFLWTVNRLAEAERVRDLGAFALCTDDPSLFTGEMS